MNNEPENRVQDPSVTETYRALANERTPDHLTRQVLKQAADVRTPYARARAWMRPAAWAATVGLSLAIVLELTRIPSSDPDYVSISTAADSDAPGNQATRNDDVALPTRSLSAESPASVSTSQSDAADSAARKRAKTEAPLALETPSKEEFASRAETVMEEAESQARARAGSDTGSVGAPAEADAPIAEAKLSEQASTDLAAAHRDAADRLAAKKVSEDARSAAASFAATSTAATSGQACPESERETADTWLACIRQLRKSGRDEQADEEYEEFRQLFPEFDDSVTDK